MVRLILVVAAVGACGGGGGGPDAGAPPDASRADAAIACGAGEFAETLTFRDGGDQGPAVAGVHACVMTHPSIPCVDTPIDGHWTFCAPANSEIAISFEKPGYMPTLIGWVTGTSQPELYRAHNPVISPTSACGIWQDAGYECPPTDAGLLYVKAVTNQPDEEVFPAALAGVAVTAPGANVYYATNGTIDPTATATPANGNAFVGDLAIGDDVITLADPGTTCGAFSYDAWPGSVAGTIRVPIRAGFRSFAVVTCE